jgi:ABC-type antimicrobial peptide transport system permease subunit
VLHLSVGDELAYDEGERHLRFRIVAALDDSVLQGEIIVSESRFIEAFPSEEGYRYFLVDASGDASAVAAFLEERLATFGFDATSAPARLAAFHRVENTYLSTFQALGALGLLLGTIGLATVMFRNVLERRRELALLRAVGYDARHVSIVIMAEAVLLLGAGLVAGVGCALLAVAPAWLSRGGALPGAGLAALLAAVAVAGIISSLIATRAALGGRMLDALRAE